MTDRRGDARGNPREYRSGALEALASDDWHTAHQWAKGWISSGGGARSVEPWLVYVASSLQRGQPRTAVHSADLALRHWISDEIGRAVIHYARGEVIRTRLRDPKTAQADLDVAAFKAPQWLRAAAVQAQAECRVEADASRKRKPSVRSAPSFDPSFDDGFVAPTPPEADSDLSTSPPDVWEAFARALNSQDAKQRG